MITKTATLASDAVVLYSMNEFNSPKPNAAITVPLICPRPPTTTTRKAQWIQRVKSFTSQVVPPTSATSRVVASSRR